MQAAALRAIVLAGDRPGGSALAQSEGVAAAALVKVAGQTTLNRVLTTLTASKQVSGGLVVGPAAQICASDRDFESRLAAHDFKWLPPAAGPSRSVLKALEGTTDYPQLVTAGDHALLTPAIVDRFIGDALDADADLVLGLVPYPSVMSAFPQSRRTRLKFRDGSFCGSNLFLVRRQNGTAAFKFWREMEHLRKQPWRMAARIGLPTLLRYLCGYLTLERALGQLSEKSGATIKHVVVNEPRAAVDVDSRDDLRLATQILNSEA